MEQLRKTPKNYFSKKTFFILGITFLVLLGAGIGVGFLIPKNEDEISNLKAAKTAAAELKATKAEAAKTAADLETKKTELTNLKKLSTETTTRLTNKATEEASRLLAVGKALAEITKKEKDLKKEATAKDQEINKLKAAKSKLEQTATVKDTEINNLKTNLEGLEKLTGTPAEAIAKDPETFKPVFLQYLKLNYPKQAAKFFTEKNTNFLISKTAKQGISFMIKSFKKDENYASLVIEYNKMLAIYNKLKELAEANNWKIEEITSESETE